MQKMSEMTIFHGLETSLESKNNIELSANGLFCVYCPQKKKVGVILHLQS